MLIKYSSNIVHKNSVLTECIDSFQKELLLEAKILDVEKIPLKMNQSDIDFLHQFNPRWWKQAVKKRFDLLFEALKEREEVRKIYYDKLYDYQLDYAKKELERSPILKFLSSDVQDAMLKNTAHRQTMEKIVKLADQKFWQGVGKKYESNMEFNFTGSGNKTITYDKNPYIKELIEAIEGEIGEKGGIDLSNPHEVKIETTNDKGESKIKIKRKTNGFEFPEEETINEMQKKWLSGIANGLLSAKKINSFVSTDDEGNVTTHAVTHVPSVEVFGNTNMKINDTFSFDHEQKRMYKSLRKLFNYFKNDYNKAKVAYDEAKSSQEKSNAENTKLTILKNLIESLKRQLPFVAKYPDCNSYKDCEGIFHDLTLDSKNAFFKKAFNDEQNNLKKADLGIPDSFFGNESLFETLIRFLAAKQLIEWAKEGKLKNANNENVVFDSEKQDLVFPELKIPTFEKELKFRQKKHASKGGGYEEKTEKVQMPVLLKGGFVKEHDEDDSDHSKQHENLPRRGEFYNPRTGKIEHRFVSVDSFEKAGHQGTDHDRIGTYHPTQHIAGVEFLDIRDPEIKNRLEKLIREEELCTYKMTTKDGKTRIVFSPASHEQSNTVLCGVAKSIYYNLTGGEKMDERDLSDENEYVLNNFPIIYKFVVISLLNNLNSNKFYYLNQRKQYITQLVTDFKQKNIAGKQTRRKRTLEKSTEIKPKQPIETKNELLNLINKLKYNFLMSCSEKQKGICTPCNPEEHACEIKASYPIESVIQKAEEYQKYEDKAEKNLNPSVIEKHADEADQIEKMLVALVVAKDLKTDEKTLSGIDQKIETTAKEIKYLFTNEKNKKMTMVDTVKSILRRLGFQL